MSDNPLLQPHELPPFSQIKVEHILPAVDQAIVDYRSLIDRLTASQQAPTWDNFVAPMEQASRVLSNLFSPVSHLANVKDSADLREAYREAVQRISAFDTDRGQHAGLYARFQALHDSTDFALLSDAQQAAVEHALRDFKLAGVALPAEQQAQFKQLMQDLARLENQFSENVLDATQGWTLRIDDETELSGLPASARATLAANAQQADQAGWLVTLEYPSYLPVMTYADNRTLRQKVHEAFTTRASDQGPNAGQWDNSGLMTEILGKRLAAAKLLGFEHYAGLSLATKMAKAPHEVTDFLHDLARQSVPQARTEMAELADFARQELGIEQLQPWDMAYASEKLKEARYAVSDEQLRPYFPVPCVLSGLFETVRRLYGIRIEAVTDFDRYHPDVQLYNLLDDDQLIARFYLDLYARKGKRGGAWMDDCRARGQYDDGLQLPVAYLTCNFTAPIGDQPSLLTHDEVVTLFHEFGHGLHHMLTQVDVSAVSGINGVAWDAVELPSQFMENFCWEPEALAFISGHVETGAPLPKDLLDKMLAARNFQSAMQMVRQLEFSLFDFNVHQASAAADTAAIRAVLAHVREEVTVVPLAAYTRFENSFSHIFAGGYAAGYYSYKWAEVLSADAFSRFEEEGLFSSEAARDFRQKVLARGAARPAAELFKDFRGREPSVEPLLRHSGITGKQAA
ncbi:MAG: oligopeptidase A [Natronospirillum sp.]